MKTIVALLALCSSAVAADCRQLVQVHGGYKAYQQPVFLKQVYVPQYYQVGQSIQAEALAEAAAIRAISKLESRITALLTQRENNTRPPAPVPSMPDQPPPLPIPREEQDAGLAVEAEVQAIFVAHSCVKCHGGVRPKKDLNLTDISLPEVRARACLIYANVDLGFMPPAPDHEPLTNPEVAKVRLWLASVIKGDSQ